MGAERFGWRVPPALDLSGSEQGAGGVGGLCFETAYQPSAQYPYPEVPPRIATISHATFDYNGNLTSLRNTTGNNGGTDARYEYGPFGESLTSRDTLAGTNPFRFSTKYTDPETGLLYYGYRYYNAGLGRWMSRDPMGETDGSAEFVAMQNNPNSRVDVRGLWSTEVHHQIAKDWIFSFDKSKSVQEAAINFYEDFSWPWKCPCVVNIQELISDGSDYVDGDGAHRGPFFLGFAVAQLDISAYQHAMRAPNQTVAQAETAYRWYLASEKATAISLSISAKQSNDCEKFQDAVRTLGHAFHAFTDSLSPAHEGFQPWYDMLHTYQYGLDHQDGPDYATYLATHASLEDITAYRGSGGRNRVSMVTKIREELDTTLRRVLMSN